jgi:hypothetical protein
MLANAYPGGVLSSIDKQVHEVIVPMRPRPLTSDDYHDGLLGALAHCDEEVYRLIGREYDRQRTTLQLIAAESHCSRAVLAALGSVVQNKTTEGFAGARFHGGCQIVDSSRRSHRPGKEARPPRQQPAGTGAGSSLVALPAATASGLAWIRRPVSHGPRVHARILRIEQYRRSNTFLDYDAIHQQASVPTEDDHLRRQRLLAHDRLRPAPRDRR